MILLYNDRDTDCKLTTPGRVCNEVQPPRWYQAQGHYLALEGPGHIISYDAEEICKIPGWRLATAQEQNTYTVGEHAAARLEEAAAPSSLAVLDESATPEVFSSVHDAPGAPEVSKPSVMTTATAPKSAAGKDN